MKLSKTSTNATLALAVLAQHESGNFLQAREIAKQIGIPTVSALKILQTLARQDLIQSQLGRSGGYTMSHDPSEVSLLQIVEAIDGPVSGQTRVSAVPEVFSAAHELLERVCSRVANQARIELGSVTLADFLRDRTPADVKIAG